EWSALREAMPIDLAAAEASLAPDDLLTVIYTSGTTGPPKGVMLSHRNVLASLSGYSSYNPRPNDQGRTLVSYLPMAHIAERMVSHYAHLLRGPQVVPCPDATALGTY